MLIVLIYIHAVFARGPINCLQHIQKDWPRDGILRVEIIQNAAENYTLIDSYRKEYLRKQLTEMFGIFNDMEDNPDDGLFQSESAYDGVGGQLHQAEFVGHSVEVVANDTPQLNSSANYSVDEEVQNKSSGGIFQELSEFDLLTRVGMSSSLHL